MKAMTGLARVSVSMDPPTLSRQSQREGRLDPERKRRLDESGFDSDPKAKALRRKTRLNDLILIHPEFAGM